MLFVQAEIGLYNCRNGLSAKAATLKTNFVNTKWLCIMACCHNIWRNIHVKCSHTANHSMTTNSTKLVNCSKTTKDNVVINGYVTCKSCVVREDTVIADYTIMSDVGIYHEQVV